MGEFGIGQPVRREEDPYLVRGAGRYVDDAWLPGQALAHVLRSPHSHARIRHIDTTRAKALPGIDLILTGDDPEILALGSQQPWHPRNPRRRPGADGGIVYDASGQLVTGSFQDYCLPRADNFCPLELGENEVPTKTNPLGVKGAGESGTVGALPAVMSAVNDALHRIGAPFVGMPATSEATWRAIEAAKRAS
jgi:CO/xanthine dehydrogenase Mo-binding subunit